MNHRRTNWMRRARRFYVRIRHRLGLAWRPTDIEGCVLWLRPSAGVTTVWRSLVTRWRDRTSRTDMVSATGSESPLFVARSATLNHRPSIRFGGMGERLQSRRGLRQPIGRRGLSVFAVISPSTVGTHRAELLRWSGWTADVGLELDTKNGLHGRVESNYESGVHLLRGRAYLVGLVIGESEATLHINGAVARTIAGAEVVGAEVDAPAPLCIGGGPGCFRGEIGDVVIYDHALSAAELDDLKEGLCAHYGLSSRRGG